MFYKNFLKWICIFLAISVSSQLLANDWLYTVRPNDDASSIGNKYLINPYRIDEVLRYNQLPDSKELLAGTVLKFPLDMLKFGPARVQVLSVQGDVVFLRNDISESLSTAHSIQLGDKIHTQENSYTVLRFADKSELLLGSNSELFFDVLTRWGRTGMVDSRMRLLKGSAEGRVETLQGPGAHFEVHTPSAVATVRGTEFRVRVSQQNTEVTYNEVSEGKVNVDNKISELLIPQGFGIVSEKGKAADKPVELLAAPQLVFAENLYPAKPVTIAWQKDDKADGYRVELFADNEYKQQIKSYFVQATRINFNAIDSGDYAIRIRAIDSNGLEGLDSKHQFKLNEAPMAPTGLSAIDTRIVGEKLHFSWQPQSNAETYHLEISSNKDFSNLLVEKQVDNPSFSHLAEMPPGDYFWRTRGENEYGKGYYSDTQPFSLKLPAEPQINQLDDTELGQEVAVTWSKVPYAQSYQWQLATDENFESIVDSSVSKINQINLKALESDNYYFRVAAVGPHNNERYGPAKSFQVYEKGNGKNPFMLSSLLLILLAL